MRNLRTPNPMSYLREPRRSYLLTHYGHLRDRHEAKNSGTPFLQYVDYIDRQNEEYRRRKMGNQPRIWEKIGPVGREAPAPVVVEPKKKVRDTIPMPGASYIDDHGYHVFMDAPIKPRRQLLNPADLPTPKFNDRPHREYTAEELRYINYNQLFQRFVNLHKKLQIRRFQVNRLKRKLLAPRAPNQIAATVLSTNKTKSRLL